MNNNLDTIGQYIEDAMASWHVPGLALAVIQGDDVLHQAGYGVRDIETNEPINADTVFAIASVTKSFTAMGVALLVDQGVLEWDKPVRDYLPDFKLSDGYVSEKITLRDLLSHRSGLPRHDLAWYGTSFTRDELIKNVAYLQFSKGFREAWQYQNLMYVTAGYLSGKMTDMSWEEFIQAYIFDQLAMTRSWFSPDTALQQGNFASPYRVRRGKAEGEEDTLELMPYYTDQVMGPAGSIHSCVNDLTNWLKVHLNEGRFNDQAFVSPGNLVQMHHPQMILPVDGFKATLFNTTISTYGMGWFVEPYRGHTLIHHGGNIDGFSTLIAFVPQAKIGVIVLTNVDGKPLRDILAYEVCDRLLDLPNNNWNQRWLALYDEMYAAIDRDRDVTADEQIQDAPPSHPIEAYVGEYEADGYADFAVKHDEDGLSAQIAGDWFPLNHYHYDIFNLDLDRFELRMPVSFLMNVHGEIDAVSLQVEQEVDPILFKRKPLTIDAAILNALVGRFDLPMEGMELSITLKKDKLYMNVTGQTEAELQPRRITDAEIEFLVKGATGIRLEFQSDAQGTYNKAVLKQPNMVFEAARILD